VAGTLVPALLRRGKEVWVDLEYIPPAADWRDRIDRAIDAATAFVFVLTPDSVASQACRDELDQALSGDKRLVPVLHRDVQTASVPEALEKPNWIRFRDSDDQQAAQADLLEALETDLAWRDTQARLTVRAAEWTKAGRDRSYLLRGSDLRMAESWLRTESGAGESPSGLQVQYVLDSRRAAGRRQRTVLAATITALVISIGLAIFALVQRNIAVQQSHTAQSRELAAVSQSQLDSNPQLGVLLAAAGARISPTTEAISALRTSLAANHQIASVRLPSIPVGSRRSHRTGATPCRRDRTGCRGSGI
jgi:TIR domain